MSDSLRFLDTSIAINKTIGHSKERKEIEIFVKEGDCFISTYVIGEFKTKLIKDCIFIHAILKKERNIQDAFVTISNMSAELSTERSLKLLALGIEKKMWNREFAIVFFENLIEMDLMNALLKDISIFKSPTSCGKERQEPNKENSIYKICLDCTKLDCKIGNFCRNNKRNFESTIRVTRNTEGDLRAFLLSDTSPTGKQKCKDFADEIIAIEMPENSALISGDNHHKDICDVLGKKCIILEKYTKNH
jgi:hypothetical protein